MKTDNRQQLLVIIAAIGMALLIGDKMILGPLTRSWDERSKRIDELRKTVAKGKELVGRQTLLESQWRSMTNNTLSSSVSVAEQQMLTAVNRWSQDSRVNLTSFNKQWKHFPDDNYATLECRMDAAGDLASLTRFLHDIEKDPIAVRVESVELSARDPKGQQLTLALQVSGLALGMVENPNEK